ncbi:ABC transporter permease [Halobacillus campisalis]|uniref:ABC transporter permease n=1 Tax=Halobacillus campisalis TaxID=435909 RepID=A0ABW2K3W5_9BACI|nr:ABC transporter permease [Halobacillus campisalis]
MSSKLYEKTGILSTFILRQDRFKIPIWLISIIGFTLLVAFSFTSLYSSDQERMAMAETMVNPAMVAMVGIGYGINNYTFGAMMAHQMLLLSAVVVGMMSILIVARHTRTEEEDGQIELIRSLPTGRLSTLTATSLVMVGVHIVLGLLTATGLIFMNIESVDVEGSLLYGAVLTATGIFFTSVTALFAQVSESGRGVAGLSMSVLGAAYLIRAIGDVSNETLAWFSPLGWVTRTEVYVTDIWWPIFLMAAVAVVIFIAAFYLSSIRDLQSGFLPSRVGKRNASAFLQSPFGLALRLQRTGIISWAAGMLILGLSYGSVLGDLDSFFESNDMVTGLLRPVDGFSLTEQFITLLMAVISMICTIPPLMAVFKLKGEENKNRVEHLLSRAVSRWRLIGSYLLIALVNSFVMLSLAAFGMGMAGLAVMEDPIDLATFYQAGIVYLPAMWVMIGLAVFLVGVKPSLSSIAWLYLGYSFITVYLGGLFQFPEWVTNLSPFAHIPQLPVDEMQYTNVFILTIVAALFMAAGLLFYRKRDIKG